MVTFGDSGGSREWPLLKQSRKARSAPGSRAMAASPFRLSFVNHWGSSQETSCGLKKRTGAFERFSKKRLPGVKFSRRWSRSPAPQSAPESPPPPGIPACTPHRPAVRRHPQPLPAAAPPYKPDKPANPELKYRRRSPAWLSSAVDVPPQAPTGSSRPHRWPPQLPGSPQPPWAAKQTPARSAHWSPRWQTPPPRESR
jgi:hypothetical protein